MCDGRKVYKTASNGRRYLWTSEGCSAWVCEDGSWLEYGSFGRDTWGLHLAADVYGKGSTWCIRAGIYDDQLAEATEFLAKLADGWRPVNWC